MPPRDLPSRPWTIRTGIEHNTEAGVTVRKASLLMVITVCFVLACILADAAPLIQKDASEDASIEAMLVKARAYCRRLDRAALDFVCREEVKEKTNAMPRPASATMFIQTTNNSLSSGVVRVQPAPPESFSTTTYLYDYQYVRKGTDVRERRDLVKKDGEDVVKADTRIETLHFKFAEVLFGPSLLLGQEAAEGHVYRLLKTEKVKGEKAAVIDCASRAMGAAGGYGGKAWVRITDGAVLKIEWDPTTFGGFFEVIAVADKFKMKPKIKSETEFGVERNGIRFPSLDLTEEAYTAGGQSIYTRSIITAKYFDYKFFTVETASEIRRP